MSAWPRSISGLPRSRHRPPYDSLVTRSEERRGDWPFPMSGDLVKALVSVCLLAIATNAVLIQTIVLDENAPIKTIVRVAVMGLAGVGLLLRRVRIE